MGRMPGRVLLVGGPDLGEDEVEYLGLWAPEEEGGSDISESSEEEDGSGPPPWSMFFFLFSLCSGDEMGFFLSFVRWCLGRRGTEMPHFDCASWPGVGKG